MHRTPPRRHDPAGEFSLDDASADKIDRLMALGHGVAVEKANLQAVEQRVLGAGPGLRRFRRSTMKNLIEPYDETGSWHERDHADRSDEGLCPLGVVISKVGDPGHRLATRFASSSRCVRNGARDGVGFRVGVRQRSRRWRPTPHPRHIDLTAARSNVVIVVDDVMLAPATSGQSMSPNWPRKSMSVAAPICCLP